MSTVGRWYNPVEIRSRLKRVQKQISVCVVEARCSMSLSDLTPSDDACHEHNVLERCNNSRFLHDSAWRSARKLDSGQHVTTFSKATEWAVQRYNTFSLLLFLHTWLLVFLSTWKRTIWQWIPFRRGVKLINIAGARCHWRRWKFSFEAAMIAKTWQSGYRPWHTKVSFPFLKMFDPLWKMNAWSWR